MICVGWFCLFRIFLYTAAMIVTISGLPGAGKTTVGRLLAKKLRVRFYSMGALRRQAARERGMTLEEFNALGETKGFTDKYFDEWQAAKGRKMKHGVIEGRTSFHFIPHSLKVFLSVKPHEGAKRIWRDTSESRKFEAHFSTLASVKKSLTRRIASDRRRYRKYYQLNIFSPTHYDYILDTTKMTPDQVVREIAAVVAAAAHSRPVDGRRTSKTVTHKPKLRKSRKR